ncbi:hypothetical protein B0F90DRAFT_1820384 [Multifurca ochricompacta]|uniref:NB-ARC domain-containing protein n=1 Tax=Multifurca ochricompacta TaxID=376703 RepID=A0AAD4QJV6_9AGAM|nr:hypothetical protein B0F90DRAFT_1820384 [Multifurca ochricompacta]
MFSASSSSQQLTSDTPNPVSSGAIDGYNSIANNAIQISLAALKEGSSLASKIPYIAPIAGLILQVLTMRDEVKQYKAECEVVMQKLIRVAGLLVHVGRSCETHKLKEGDLPAGLRDILKSLQSELDGIKHVLGECAKTKGARSLLLRKDILGKIKQYDATLLNVVEVFQAELLLDIRFALISERREGTHAVPTDVTTSVVRPSLAPPSPQIFFGRDAELAHIIHIIFTNIGSRPARIAILGPGGYGKTTLANAVLSHDRVQEHFEDARYFISCESVTSPDALLIQISKTLGLSNEIKHSIEVLLSRITSLRHVTVLVTMRGAQRPGQTEWTQPFLDPLGTIGLTAAKEIWRRIVGSYDDFSEKLIMAVDCVPLAVDLLAHLSQATPPMLLWEEWNSRQTKLIGGLSINSHRMTSNPDAKDLLGILSMLLDGLHIKQLNRFKGILVDMDMMSCLQFFGNASFTSSTHKTSLEEFYISLACIDMQKATPEAYVEMVLEVNNTKAMLSDFLKSNFANQPRLVHAIVMFTELCMNIGDFSTALLDQCFKHLLVIKADATLLIQCLKVWGRLYYGANDMEAAKDKFLEAERHCLSGTANVVHLHGTILNDLGHVYLCQFLLNEASISYQKALKLNQASQNIIGQGISHFGLGRTYAGLGMFIEAEVSYQQALEFHKAAGDNIEQGNDYQGLGQLYQRQNKLAEAEASYKKALKFQKLANHGINQGSAHLGLGHIYKQLNRLDDAVASYHKALELHMAANNLYNQGIDHQGLGDIYLLMNKENEAEISFQKALELKKAANDVVGQGIALTGLGKVYMRRSQLKRAQGMFEEALNLYTKVQAAAWEKEAKWYLDDVLAKLGRAASK